MARRAAIFLILLLGVVSAGVAATRSPVAVPEATEQAASYYRSGNLLWIFETSWGLLIPALFLFTGLSARIRGWASRLGRKWLFTIVLYFVAFTLISFVIDLPLGYYQDYLREHAYGLSNQSLGKWASDNLMALAVNLVIGSLFLWVPYLLLEKSPDRWWIYTSLLAVPFMFLIIVVAPIWIVPLFNKSGPMQNKPLEASILELADRAGIDGSRIFELETSVDSKRLNAAVQGFGGTKRILVTDTLVGSMSTDEVLFTVGHEMGHYLLGHVPKTVLFLSLLVGLTLGLAHRLARWMMSRWKDRFGFDRLGDIASLPLILFLANLLSLGSTPAFMAFSRANEHEADRFGLEITRNNQAAATAFVKLQQENLRVPRPGILFKLWRASHPPMGERIDFANGYAPWERGEPGVYDHLFRGAATGAASGGAQP